MPKINCNDGCLDNFSAACVKYTGTQIDDPLIIQNTNYNDIINILVDKINTIPGGSNDVYNDVATDPVDVNNDSLNTLYPNAFLGFTVHYTNIIGQPTTVFRFSKYDTTNGLWLYFVGQKLS